MILRSAEYPQFPQKWKFKDLSLFKHLSPSSNWTNNYFHRDMWLIGSKNIKHLHILQFIFVLLKVNLHHTLQKTKKYLKNQNTLPISLSFIFKWFMDCNDISNQYRSFSNWVVKKEFIKLTQEWNSQEKKNTTLALAWTQANKEMLLNLACSLPASKKTKEKHLPL